MSRVPLGKVLLRNVIRHTDAHNKIQEESEMWKIREMEKQSKDIHWGKEKRVIPNCSSSRMRSDGFDEEASWKARNLTSVSMTTEEDLQHSRYWNKKLYEYEANMPDRWGHSGYKELYPEEFDTDSDQREQDEQNSVNGKRLSQHGKPSSLEVPKRKKVKKSHGKKRKKKSHKKRKKKKQEQRSPAMDSSQDSEDSQRHSGKRKRKRHKKAKKVLAKVSASSSGQESDSSKESVQPPSSEDSEAEGKQPRRKRRRHHAPMLERGGEKVQEKRSKRKNWKVAADENSEDSSDED